MAVHYERTESSCHIHDGEDVQLQEECKHEETILNAMKDDSRRERIYVIIGILFLATIVAIVLSAAALAGQNHSKEAEELSSRRRQLNEAGWSRSGNLYYKYFTDVPVNYSTAEARCNDHGGRLAAKVLRDSAAVGDMITKSLNDVRPEHGPWIGFNDIENEGDWRWSDGGTTNNDTVRWNHWKPYPKEPNGGNSTNCANIWGASAREKLLLDDVRCSNLFFYICEIEILYSQVNTEAEELSSQSGQLNEALATTASMSTATPFDMPEWQKSKDTFYKCFSNASHDYNNAKAICGSYGGRLAAKVLRDPVAITDIVTRGCFNNNNNNKGNQGWIGFDDIEMEGDWQWSDGGAMNKRTTQWDVGQPDKRRLENCATSRILSSAKIVFHDYPCNEKFPYICEIETAKPEP